MRSVPLILCVLLLALMFLSGATVPSAAPTDATASPDPEVEVTTGGLDGFVVKRYYYPASGPCYSCYPSYPVYQSMPIYDYHHHHYDYHHDFHHDYHH